MKKTINNWEVNILELETDIYGLKFKPQLESRFNNDADAEVFSGPVPGWNGYPEVSDRNFQLMESLAKQYCTHGVMEIGVSRNGEKSFTRAILNNKPDDVPYLGVDIEDKTYLYDYSKKIYTLQENSFNQESVRNHIKLLGIDKISLFFIDGWHSLNAVINDWLYVDFLSDNGIVVFHDTNYHPGPAAFLPAIDESIFKVETYFDGEHDYGMGVAYKL